MPLQLKLHPIKSVVLRSPVFNGPKSLNLDETKVLQAFLRDEAFAKNLKSVNPGFYNRANQPNALNDQANRLTLISYVLRQLRATPLQGYSAVGVATISDETHLPKLDTKSLFCSIFDSDSAEWNRATTPRRLSDLQNRRYKVDGSVAIIKRSLIFRHKEFEHADGPRYRQARIKLPSVLSRFLATYLEQQFSFQDLQTECGFSPQDAAVAVEKLLKLGVLISDKHPSVFVEKITPAKYGELLRLNAGAGPRSVGNNFALTDRNQSYKIAAKDTTKIIKAAEFIAKSFGAICHFNTATRHLHSFKEQFRNKYDTAWVPMRKLASVFSLIDYNYVDLPAKDFSSVLSLLESDESENFACIDLSNNKNLVVKKTPGEIQFQQSLTLLPEASTLFAYSQNIDDSRFWLKGLTNPNHLSMLGRVSHDPSIHTSLTQITTQAASADFVFADIDCFIGTTLRSKCARPRLSRYSISLDSGGFTHPDALDLDDLYIRLRGENFEVYSKRLRKFVIPVRHDAHDFTKSANLPYLLLSFVAVQNSWRYLSYPMKSSRPYHPRIVFDEVVLRPRIWNFRPDSSAIDVSSWLRKVAPPRFVFLHHDDRTLLADTKTRWGFSLLERQLKRTGGLLISEAFLNDDLKESDAIEQLCARSEIFLPMTLHSDSKVSRQGHWSGAAHVPLSGAVRTIAGQDGFINLKIYGSPNFLRILLIEDLAPLLKKLGVSSNYFLIFFSEGRDYHLRLRIQTSSAARASSVKRAIHGMLAPLLKQHLVASVQEELFKPEVDVYTTTGKLSDMKAFFALSNMDSELATQGLKSGISINDNIERDLCHAVAFALMQIGSLSWTANQVEAYAESLMQSSKEGERLLSTDEDIKAWKAPQRNVVRSLIAMSEIDIQKMLFASALSGRRFVEKRKALLNKVPKALHATYNERFIHLFLNRIGRGHYPVFERQVWKCLAAVLVGRHKHGGRG